MPIKNHPFEMPPQEDPVEYSTSYELKSSYHRDLYAMLFSALLGKQGETSW